MKDFEALTPNVMARTIETVEGGGVICILLKSMNSLRQLYTMSMDIHSRFRTESHQSITPRFNERFILSLTTCSNCMVIDDQMQILPISSSTLEIKGLPKLSLDDSMTPSYAELKSLKENVKDVVPLGSIISCCKTLDQAKVLLTIFDVMSEKNNSKSVVSVTAARGRGKSAAMGLAIAAAVSFGFSNIFVTSPTPENLITLFEFVFKGFDSLSLKEHLDYDVFRSTNPDTKNCVIRINIFKDHRQTIQYIHPCDYAKTSNAELVVIDEAAAIPLPLVKKLMGSHLLFLSSTINGYEGTGRSLSLKLLNQLRQHSTSVSNSDSNQSLIQTSQSKLLFEVNMAESIRYRLGDPVEKWLNNLLCLDSTISNLSNDSFNCPLPDKCQLYYVSRDTLFSFHKASEMFLQKLMSLFVSSHYKNSPNDLQLLADSPSQHIFVLLGPFDENASKLPDILCAIQISFEGELSKSHTSEDMSRGQRASGDLIPWTLSQQFCDHDFPSLAGARIVRIATHSDMQKMGYGTRAMKLLTDYFEGKIMCLNEAEYNLKSSDDPIDNENCLLEESLEPKSKLPPLLLKLNERRAEQLHYLGVSYGVTVELLKFWNKVGFIPVYIRQTPNELTAEHTCIMLKKLEFDTSTSDSKLLTSNDDWLVAFWNDFRRRFVYLLSYQFKFFTCQLALGLIQDRYSTETKKSPTFLNKNEMSAVYNEFDLNRLDLYSNNMVDYHLIVDLLPNLARHYFLNLTDYRLSAVQSAILLCLGLQHKTVEDLEKELNLPASQILGLFNRIIKKAYKFYNCLEENYVDSQMFANIKEHKNLSEQREKMSVVEDIDLEKDAQQIRKKQLNDLKLMAGSDLEKYAVTGDDEFFKKAISKVDHNNLKSITVERPSTSEKVKIYKKENLATAKKILSTSLNDQKQVTDVITEDIPYPTKKKIKK